MAERPMQCAKRLYFSEADAEAGLRDLAERVQQTGQGGRSFRRLNVYFCPACRGWHVGRANKLPKSFTPASPAKKVPTAGELRRKLRNLEKQWQRHEDRRRAHRVRILGKLVERDLADQKIIDEIREQVRQIENVLLN